MTWASRWPCGAERLPAARYVGPWRVAPTRTQLRAHRAAIARRLGLRRSQVRVEAWRGTAWRVCVLTVRVRGEVAWSDSGGGTLAGCRDLLRRLRVAAST